FLAGLLALAGVLGVGEGHLLHRKALRVKSADFAKSGSLFQSFHRGGLADWGRLPIRASKTCCRPAEALTVPTCDSFLYGNSVIIQFENDIARHIADATDVDLHMI
ncbi:hypothetical protein, partial [Pseudomonas aeruginosa]|uniref:hypothetical protein n=1 Tax=Pseudomonas aeruginosa TaxID=287 RepID=UPI001CC94D7C